MAEDLKQIFIEEATDILASLNQSLQAWQADVPNISLVTALQRELHTLKGGARMVHQEPIARLAHALEDLLQLMIKKTHAPNLEFFEQTRKAILMLAVLHEALKSEQDYPSIDTLIGELATLSQQEPGHAALSPDKASHLSSAEPGQGVLPKDGRQGDTEEKKRSEVVRVKADSLENLNSLLSQNSINIIHLSQQLNVYHFHMMDLETTLKRLNEQLRRLEFTHTQQNQNPSQLNRRIEDFDSLELDDYSEAEQITRAITETTADLLNINRHFLEMQALVEQTLHEQSRISQELSHNITETRIVPFSLIQNRLQILCLNTATELNKKVRFNMTGQDLEIDRLILDKALPCLEHLTRNAIDHGLELPAERSRLGKPEEGLIHIEIKAQGQEIIIILSDDGAGVNLVRVKEKALAMGLLKAEQLSSPSEIIQCIFLPGFSTKEAVSSISGRGIGMDVVYNEIKNLGGSTQLGSVTGKGTQVTLKIPMTMSLYRALFFTYNGFTYGLSTTHIEGLARISNNTAASFLSPKGPQFSYNDHFYRLVHLGELLEENSVPRILEKKYFPVILLKTFPAGIGLIVDGLKGSREIVIKKIDSALTRLDILAGAAVGSDGQANLILDAAALANRARVILTRRHAKDLEEIGFDYQKISPPRLSVLVVDDSITVRKVTQNLLSRYNCEVFLAKDGIDALEQLNHKIPHIILLDIEMPRMDGFEFLTLIRAEPKFISIPVIIISSRTGPKHAQKAQELGANGIMSKPFQDQQLIDVISAQTGFSL